jgi:hypothetical protein
MRKSWSERYAAHLRSPYWANLKTKVMRRRGAKCEMCCASEKPLDLHHHHYRTFGRERQKDVAVLCRECHRLADAERRMRGAAQRAWIRVVDGCFGGPTDADVDLLEKIGWMKKPEVSKNGR